MTSYLCIPSTTRPLRRVDFADIAGLFAEEEPEAPRACGPSRIDMAVGWLRTAAGVWRDTLERRPLGWTHPSDKPSLSF